MDKFIINGGKKLIGEVKTSGAKNAILPIMCATLLTTGKSVLSNVPDLYDIRMMAHLLRIIGAKVVHENDVLEIDTTNCNFFEAPYEIVSKMRASFNVFGPMLAKFGEAKVSFPGGCAIGARPVDIHLKALEKLGAKIEILHGFVKASCEKLYGSNIEFEKVSVGATENALSAAVLASGDTNLINSAAEPEVTALIEFLIAAGAKINYEDPQHLKITGVSELNPVTMRMIPDRIEAGTFLLGGAITGSRITVTNCNPEHLTSLTKTMKLCGCKFEIEGDKITVIPPAKIKPTDIITEPYPKFPTDLQAQFMALMSTADGKCKITETIFPDRFMQVAELNRLGAKIINSANCAEIQGAPKLSGAKVMATDLRASAALVLAGMAAEGQTEISRIYHIDRGYERIETKLQKLGADIKRLKG